MDSVYARTSFIWKPLLIPTAKNVILAAKPALEGQVLNAAVVMIISVFPAPMLVLLNHVINTVI